MPGNDLALLIDAARAAGRIAHGFWRQSPEIWDKPGGAGPVTTADLAVDRMLKEELRAARPDHAGGATVLTSAATLAPEHWAGRMPPPVRRVFRASFAWRLCLVAEGRFDAALTLRPSWEWDIAAGDLIARRAGATVTDRSGAGLRFNRPDPRADGVIAAGDALWKVLQGGLAAPGSQPPTLRKTL